MASKTVKGQGDPSLGLKTAKLWCRMDFSYINEFTGLGWAIGKTILHAVR